MAGSTVAESAGASWLVKVAGGLASGELGTGGIVPAVGAAGFARPESVICLSAKGISIMMAK